MIADKWDLRFWELAQFISKWSKDISTKVGVVITEGNRIISTGYNGFPAGVSDDEVLYSVRSVKLNRVIHGEVNAILFAKQDLSKATMYVYPFPPCSNCMAVIIQSGIKKVVTHDPTPEQLSRWSESIGEAMKMADEAGVTVDFI